MSLTPESSKSRAQRESDCEELRRQASELLDGCDAETREALETHLEHCGDCDSWFDTLKSTVDLLRTLPKPVAREQLLAQLKSPRQTN